MEIAAGSVYQLAFLVDDLEAAAHGWAERTGAGPFTAFDPFEFEEPLYRGAPCQPDIGIALGFSGSLCIELIVDRDDAPTIYWDWRRDQGLGMHHVARLSDDFPATLAEYAADGVNVCFSAKFGGTTRLAYLDTVATLGCYVEIVERTPFVREALAAMQAEHRGWDGRNVLRPFSA